MNGERGQGGSLGLALVVDWGTSSHPLLHTLSVSLSLSLSQAGPHEDSTTEELLLMSLCRLACLSGGRGAEEADKQLLLHLAAPQVGVEREHQW